MWRSWAEAASIASSMAFWNDAVSALSPLGPTLMMLSKRLRSVSDTTAVRCVWQRGMLSRHSVSGRKME